MELTCKSIINLEFWAFGHGEDETVFAFAKFSKETVVGFQFITASASVLEKDPSLCSNLGNWHFIQAGIT